MTTDRAGVSTGPVYYLQIQGMFLRSHAPRTVQRQASLRCI